MTTQSKTALALTAGGSRGAYQAGVLKRIGEIPALRDKAAPFDIITGASAGAINGAAIAAHGERLHNATAQLSDLWACLTADQVYRTDVPAMLSNAKRLATDFTLGRFTGNSHAQSMLDATPLRALLARELPMENVAKAIKQQRLYALAITAAGYHSGKSYTFIQGQAEHPLWHKSRRIALQASLSVDHICASSAIPLVFAPVALNTGTTTAWFGDGALRLTHPLSPAIRLGADRILAIGIRCHNTADALTEDELTTGTSSTGETILPRRPPLAQICGVFLNAIFLDHLDADVDHLLRMNNLVNAYNQDESYTQDKVTRSLSDSMREPMRVVDPLVISPSEDFAELASSLVNHMPRAVRLMLGGLGQPDPRSADLTSYLLFDPAYTKALIDIGYRDAGNRIDEIEEFLRARN